MFGDGGFIYMYLIYGMHWMMNVVTSVPDSPQAVLIRGLREAWFHSLGVCCRPFCDVQTG
ncbi:MAG: DNA-3-methyladenine glycosylase [Gammaproteobacteria bacterium]|nr:DNA-3-methyladenine glycosylase [Gammaproteobacteria bacterium]